MAHEFRPMAELVDDESGYVLSIERVYREDGERSYQLVVMSGHDNFNQDGGYVTSVMTDALHRSGEGLVTDDRDPAVHHTERMADGGDAIFGRTDDGHQPVDA